MEGKIKDFSVCGHSCGQNRFCAVFGNRRKTRYRPCCKALRRFTSPYPGYRHGTPKAGALPTALIPDFWLLSFAPDVVKHVVKAAFIWVSAAGAKPASARVAKLCGVLPYPVPNALSHYSRLKCACPVLPELFSICTDPQLICQKGSLRIAWVQPFEATGKANGI